MSERVCAGATVMESPVWTPMGSTFSMEQMTMPLPVASRITSISISFQPSMDCSTKTSVVGESESPWLAMTRSSFALWAMPPPAPPNVKLGRMTTG